MIKGRFVEPTCAELQILEVDEVARRYRVSQRLSNPHSTRCRGRILRIALNALGGPLLTISLQFHRREKQKTVGTLLTATQLGDCQLLAEEDVKSARDDLRSHKRIIIRTEKASGKKKGKARKGEEEFEFSLKTDCHIRLSYDRFGLLLRDELIANAASERWNKPAGEVIRSLLSCALIEDTELSETRTHELITISDIVEKLPREKDKVNALLAGIIPKGGNPWGKNLMDVTRAYMAVMSGGDAISETASTSFVAQDGSGDKGWYVMIEGICQRMRASLLSQLVKEKLGDDAARVLACFAGGKKMLESGVSLRIHSSSTSYSPTPNSPMTLILGSDSGYSNDASQRRSIKPRSTSTTRYNRNSRSTQRSTKR